MGCGTGQLWTRAKDQYPDSVRLTLTDLSAAMVASAHAIANQHFGGVRAQSADVMELPFGDETFDLIVANQMLYHAPDPHRAVGEIARVLRPGGRLIAATQGPDHLKELFAIEQTVFDVASVRTQCDVFGSTSGTSILANAFAHVEWRPFVDTLRCTNAEDVVRYLRSSSPGEDGDDAQVVGLLREVERLIELGEGVLTITKETGTFVATK